MMLMINQLVIVDSKATSVVLNIEQQELKEQSRGALKSIYVLSETWKKKITFNCVSIKDITAQKEILELNHFRCHTRSHLTYLGTTSISSGNS